MIGLFSFNKLKYLFCINNLVYICLNKIVKSGKLQRFNKARQYNICPWILFNYNN